MHRVFVEKKAEFQHEGKQLLRDWRESLSVDHLAQVRVMQRYDIMGIAADQIASVTKYVLSEPQLDLAHDEIQLADDEVAFAVEYLPGQFDQRADSAAQCIQILLGIEKPDVYAATIYILKGSLSTADLSKIKQYAINAVDSHEVPCCGDVPRADVKPPAEVMILDGFTQGDPEVIRKQWALAMNVEDVAFCQSYFRDEEGRNPSLTELKMLDTYWSDHCRHTTFLTEITQATFDAEGTEPIQATWQAYLKTRENVFGDQLNQRPITLMDMALLGMRELRKSGELDNLELSDEINAASIVIPVPITQSNGEQKEEEWLVMFKNETHNHPTEIEPFGGAATCLGGCIRDPLSGRSYVYQAMRVTGAGNPLTPIEETLPGKLPQKKICQIAAAGYASYGNQIGLATGQVSEVYHPGYVAKRMEIGAVVAAAPRAQVFRGKPDAGDVILLIGGRTGRDGVGGATGSSKEHTETALENSAEVQKGDAPTERKIQRLFRNPELTQKIKICNDFGAGGISVAIGEIAPSLRINLDRVLKKYDGLDGTELAISESQERMAVCVDRSEIDYFIHQADLENLECVHVADVTDTGRLIMTWQDKEIVNLSRAFLDTNGVQQQAKVHVKGISKQRQTLEHLGLKERLADLNHCSQKGLGERFDGSVGAGTVLYPFGGKHQLTQPQAMAAKLPLLDGDSDVATLMSWGFNPHLSEWSPFHGAVYAIVESVCKIVATGGDLSQIRLTLQEYFPKLNKSPERWGLPFAALLGAFHAQQQLRLAAIGGKDSMSGSFQDLDIPPTLVSFALAPAQASKIISPEFKQTGSMISLVRVACDEHQLPDFKLLKVKAAILHELVQEGKISAMLHVGSGGIGVSLAHMSFGNGIGFKANDSLDLIHQEAYFTWILEHSEELPCELKAQLIGETMLLGEIQLPQESYSIQELQDAWVATLEPIYPTQVNIPEAKHKAVKALSWSGKTPHSLNGKAKHGCPKVLIPSFPGTNSEYDSAKVFREAGASAEILVFRNLTSKHVQESLDVLAKQIRSSQILMIPGGFSAGDEPDGSAKFIANVLRYPKVADAIMDLLKHRDGLILGICNGFQALIKTGLVPFGEIRLDADAPTLIHNTIGRHVACYVNTRVASKLSPWFAQAELGEIHSLPVSHGEGRFYASEAWLDQLSLQGQVATQYCDAQGNPSMEIEINPNGSLIAVEGITSPCGRVLGKMAHSERRGSMVAKNIHGEKVQSIFSAGVQYFA